MKFLSTSSKGEPILVVDGHEFFKKCAAKSTTTWNCSQNQKLKCRATATSIAEHVLKVTGEHFHEPKFGNPKARKSLLRIKQEVSNLHRQLLLAVQSYR